MAMTRRFLLALLALLPAATALADRVTGSGTPATQERAVPGVRSVGLAVPGVLEIVQGERETLTLSGDDNVLPLVESVVEQGALRIRFREPGATLVRPKQPLRFRLQVRSLEGIAIQGSGDVKAEALQAAKLKVSISGSGNVLLGGRGEALDVNIAGSGDVKAGRFEVKRAAVTIAGSGDARLWVRETLSASVAGSGDVDYHGEARVTSTIAGSGRVRRVGAAPG